MNKITMAALVGMATMLAGAGSAFAGDDEDAAPYMEPMCQVDSECADGEICLWSSCYTPEACEANADCWTGWCGGDGVCAEPPSCSDDSECGDGNICDYGRCAPRGRTCLSDAECGEYAHCVFDQYTTVETGTASPNSTDPDEGSGSASRDGATDPDGAQVPPPEGDEYDEGDAMPYPYVERGECRIDVEAVPENTDCRAMCEAAAACAAEQIGQAPEPSDATEPARPGEAQAGGGSDGSAAGAAPACDPLPGDDQGDPEAGCMEPYPEEDTEGDLPMSEETVAIFVEQCTVMCSYGVATGAGAANDVAAANTCLASQTSCDEMESACEPEIDVINEMMDAVSDKVDDDMMSSSATGGTTTSATDPKGVGDDGNAQELAGSPAPATGACDGSGGGAPLGLALLAAMTLLIWRRRTV